MDGCGDVRGKGVREPFPGDRRGSLNVREADETICCKL